MSILYPLDKPVTAEDIRVKARELLGRAGEWTSWEALVLGMLAEHAELVHGHYMRHVWYEVEGLGEPDVQMARDDVMLAVEVLMGAMLPRHAYDEPNHAIQGLGLWDLSVPDVVANLVVHAGVMVDDLVESLRRGPCAIVGGRLHGFSTGEWNEIIQFEDEEVRLPSVEQAFERIGLVMADDGMRDSSGSVGDADGRRRMRAVNQGRRNEERVAAAIALTNENYGLPEAFTLRLLESAPSHVRLEWGVGAPPPAGMLEVRTRPSGRETVQLQITTLDEIHPMAIADVARAGRFAALSIGRDAEIRSTGSTLQEPPIWAWAGPVPLVRHVLIKLRAGQDVDVSADGMSAGPLLSAARIELGDGAAVYAYNARTLDESLSLDQSIPDTLAHACIGNPVRLLIQAPILDDERITVQSCEVGEDGTEFEIVSPLVRLVDAPSGYGQDPEAAWLGMLEGFDETLVYGDRIFEPQAAPADAARS